MNSQEIFYSVLLAGVLGISGQVLRIAIGMKKLNEDARAVNLTTGDVFITRKLVISILIGFSAGILAWVVSDEHMLPDFFKSKNAILGIIAAGYSGTDFIEGIMSKYLPKGNAQAAANAANNTLPKNPGQGAAGQQAPGGPTGGAQQLPAQNR